MGILIEQEFGIDNFDVFLFTVFFPCCSEII